MNDTPKTDVMMKFCFGTDQEYIRLVDVIKLERELNAANERIKRLEEALDLVIPNCSWVHHSKKHQHKCGEPCPVVALIEKSKEDKL